MTDEAVAEESGPGGRLAPATPRAARPAEEQQSSGRGFAHLPTFRSLRHRDFRLLWFGTLFSGLGQWTQQAALGWLTYELTGSALLLGAVNGAKSVPLLLLGPFGGLAADRLDRRKIMLTTQCGLMIVTAIFATIIVTGHLQAWHLFVIALLTGTGWAFNMPVRQSVIPNLVPRADLLNAVALSSAGFNSSRILGPTAAGLLIAAAGAGLTFYLQAAAFLGVALMVWQMRIPSIAGARRGSLGANLSEGARFIFRHPTLRVQLLLAFGPVVLGLPYVSLLPIFAGEVLQVGPEGYGLLMAAPGLGAVTGTLGLASLGNVTRKGLLLLGAVFVLGLTLVLFSLSESFPLSLLLLFVAGAVQMLYLSTNQTAIQLSAPDELRGRVMGVYALNQGLMPLGSLFAGGLASVFGAPTAVLVMGILVALMAVGVAASSSELRRV